MHELYQNWPASNVAPNVSPVSPSCLPRVPLVSPSLLPPCIRRVSRSCPPCLPVSSSCLSRVSPSYPQSAKASKAQSHSQHSTDWRPRPIAESKKLQNSVLVDKRDDEGKSQVHFSKKWRPIADSKKLQNSVLVNKRDDEGKSQVHFSNKKTKQKAKSCKILS